VASVIIYVKSKKYSFGDMNADEELGHEMYDNMKKLWVHVNRFKQDGIKVKPLPPELSNQYNFLRETFISMESCRVAADYRSGLSPSHPCSSLVQPGPVFLLLGWHGDASVSFLLKEFSSTFHLSLFLLLVSLLELSKLTVEICLAFGEPNLLTLLDHALLSDSHLISIGKTILILTDLFGLDPFGNGYHMSIKGLNLWHEVNNLESVVWLLGKWVPE